MRPTDETAAPVIDRLAAAVNDHDLDAITACFAEGYLNRTPAHPSRGFAGREQVRRNWAQILAGVPDIRCAVLRRSSGDDLVWTEWEHTGTRADGRPHEMRGVIIFGVSHDVIHSADFYLEPVDEEGGTVDEAVRSHVGGAPREDRRGR